MEFRGGPEIALTGARIGIIREPMDPDANPASDDYKKVRTVIDQAIRNSSKPYLALTVVEQAGEEDSPGIPRVLRSAINTTLRLARSAAPVRPSSEGKT